MRTRPFLCLCALAAIGAGAPSIDVKQTSSFRRIKAHLDATPAVDTHDHLPPFDLLRGREETDQGFGMTLHSIWNIPSPCRP